jgi:hypothetical protein
MKRTVFIAFTLVLVLCLLFVSAVYSKPPAPRTFTRYCCYAKFVDVDASNNPYAIASDGLGVYKDLSISGYNQYIDRDKIQVETYDDNGELKFLRVYVGKPEIPYRGDPGRRVKLNFDFLSDATQKSGLGTAIYDSLVWLSAVKDSRRGNASSNGKYYINDRTAHFYIQLDGSSCRSGILIDKSNLGDPSSQPPPITQATVNAFYDDSDPQYWTPVQSSLETGDPNMVGMTNDDTDRHDQIVYFLYVNQLNFTVTNKDGQNKPCEWTITPVSSRKLNTTNLYVCDSANSQYISLATYPILNFKLIVSLNQFNTAPPRFGMPTTLWGEIKGE